METTGRSIDMRDTLTLEERWFLALLKGVLHPSEQDAILASVSLDPASLDAASRERLFRLAGMHHLETMFLQAMAPFSDAGQYARWQEKVIQYEVMEQCQKQEWQVITDALEKEGIDHLPFKGFAFKALYPNPSLRQMSDLDFFLRKEDRGRVREILEGLSYETIHFGSGSQDVYYKAPAVHVEMHFGLSFSCTGRMDDRYFQQLFRETLDRPSDSHRKDPDDVVSYAYMIAHLAKHYLGYGTGVRSVLDVYLFSGNKQETADSEAFAELLSRTGLLDFYRHLRKLSEIWFDDRPSEPLYEQMGAYILQSGIYGHRKNHARNAISRDQHATASTYFFRHLASLCFPSPSHMKNTYPWADRSILLLPLTYPVRAAEILLTRRNRLRLFNLTRRLSYEEIRTLRKLHKRTGLY